jgi:outer membrane protein assembly factor BamB
MSINTIRQRQKSPERNNIEQHCPKWVMKVKRLATSGFLFCSSILSVSSSGGPWPGWRGPDGNGISKEINLPLNWSTNQNVRWRVALPERGDSTPAVWGNRIFITQPLTKENRRCVMCFNRKDGKLLWQSSIKGSEGELTTQENPFCTSSPAADEKRVIAWFGTTGIFCYDVGGHELWHRDLGSQSHQWGYGSSLVIYKDLCLLNFGPGKRSFVVALDKSNGRIMWQYDVAPIADDTDYKKLGGDPKWAERPGAQKLSEFAGSWATPLLVHARRRDELVVALPLELLALAPRTGEKLWTCRGPNIGAYSSPFSGDGIIGLMGSGFQNISMAVRPEGHGDVTATHRLWCSSLANSKAYIGSGIIYDGHMYVVSGGGFAACHDLKTGATVWEERLTGTGSRNGSYSSPVLSGERLYVANQNADTFVVRAKPRFECLATNSIGGEPMNARWQPRMALFLSGQVLRFGVLLKNN